MLIEMPCIPTHYDARAIAKTVAPQSDTPPKNIKGGTPKPLRRSRNIFLFTTEIFAGDRGSRYATTLFAQRERGNSPMRQRFWPDFACVVGDGSGQVRMGWGQVGSRVI